MNKREVIMGALGVAVIAGQLYTMGKIVETHKNVEATAQKVEAVKEQVDATQKDAAELKKKVERIDKIVTYRTPVKLKVSQKDLHCLAKNIFHEAGVEDRAGKLAVAQVTLNRLRTKRWGETICEVVYAKAQFSWTLEKKKRWAQPKGKLWEESVAVAEEFVSGQRVKGIEKSKFYHTDYIRQPYWAKNMIEVKQIGQHIFYRES